MNTKPAQSDNVMRMFMSCTKRKYRMFNIVKDCTQKTLCAVYEQIHGTFYSLGIFISSLAVAGIQFIYFLSHLRLFLGIFDSRRDTELQPCGIHKKK